MTQDTPLHRDPELCSGDALQRFEDIEAELCSGDVPTRADLLRLWLDGDISLDEYAALLNAFYPMSVAEYARQKDILAARWGMAAKAVLP